MRVFLVWLVPMALALSYMAWRQGFVPWPKVIPIAPADAQRPLTPPEYIHIYGGPTDGAAVAPKTDPVNIPLRKSADAYHFLVQERQDYFSLLKIEDSKNRFLSDKGVKILRWNWTTKEFEILPGLAASGWHMKEPPPEP